jgi:hypothetical protein
MDESEKADEQELKVNAHQKNARLRYYSIRVIYWIMIFVGLKLPS